MTEFRYIGKGGGYGGGPDTAGLRLPGYVWRLTSGQRVTAVRLVDAQPGDEAVATVKRSATKILIDDGEGFALAAMRTSTGVGGRPLWREQP